MGVYGSSGGGSALVFNVTNQFDNTGLEYMLKAKEGAVAKVAAMEQAAKPDMSSYEKDLEKLKATSGDKWALHKQYKHAFSNLKQGAQQHGGWLRYSMTDDYKSSMNELSIWAFNTQQAEKNLKDLEDIEKVFTPNEKSLPWIGNAGEPAIKGYVNGKPVYYTVQEYFSKMHQVPNLSKDGMINPINIVARRGTMDNFVQDVNKLAAGLGYQKWDNPTQLFTRLLDGQDGGQHEMMGQAKTGGKSNRRNLHELALAAYGLLSDEGKAGLDRQYIQEGGDWKDDKAKSKFIQKKIMGVLSPKSVEESELSMSYSVVNKAGERRDMTDANWGEAVNSMSTYVFPDNNAVPKLTYYPDGKGGYVKGEMPVIVGSNHPKYDSEFFAAGQPLKNIAQSYSVGGITYSFGTTGKDAAYESKNIPWVTTGNVGNKVLVPMGKNSSTGKYDIPLTREQIKGGRVINSGGKAIETYVAVDAQGNKYQNEYKLMPAQEVEVEARIEDIRDNGNFHVIMEEGGKAKKTSFFPENWFANAWRYLDMGSYNSQLSNHLRKLVENQSIQASVVEEDNDILGLDYNNQKLRVIVMVPIPESYGFKEGGKSILPGKANQDLQNRVNYAKSAQNNSDALITR